MTVNASEVRGDLRPRERLATVGNRLDQARRIFEREV